MSKSYQIKSFQLGPMDNLIHLMWDIKTKKAAIFDPAWDSDFILNFCEENNLDLEKIMITHTHYDHINAVSQLLEKKSIPVYINKDELEYSQIKFEVKPQDLKFTEDNMIVDLGETKIKCINTPGHTICGVCYLLSDDIITGDTVFIYGCGHCALPGADVTNLFYSLKKLKNLIKPNITVHTSHTYGITNTSTWQQQLDGNPFLHFDNLEMFVEYRQNLHDKMRTYPMAPISKKEILQLFNV